MKTSDQNPASTVTIRTPSVTTLFGEKETFRTPSAKAKAYNLNGIYFHSFNLHSTSTYDQAKERHLVPGSCLFTTRHSRKKPHDPRRGRGDVEEGGRRQSACGPRNLERQRDMTVD